MAIIKTDGNFMGLPMNIARGNPIPLDKSEIWYSYEEMADYAANNPVAYVGQILGLVDEANQCATAYIILNTDGALQEVGKATVGDNSTIILENETLSLHDFGKKYYRYVPAQEDEENGISIPATYVEQEVTEEFPWRAGLEPRVVLDGTNYVLGWYEPNPTTIEGVNNQVAGIQTSIESLTRVTSGLSTRIDDTYTKAETNAQIAAATHLKRVIVGSVEEIDLTAPDAEQYIYMVPSGLEAEDNKYYEYIVVETVSVDNEGVETRLKTKERVGSWEVDLKKYALQENVNEAFLEVEAALQQINKDIETIDARAEKNYIKSVKNEFNVSEEGQLQLVSIPPSVDVTTSLELINKFLSKEDAENQYLSKKAFEDLKIQIEAEKNLIASISEEFHVDDKRHLTLVSVSGEKLRDLGSNVEFSQLSDSVGSLLTDTNNLQNALKEVNGSLATLSSKFNSYTTLEQHNQDLGEVWKHLTWENL